MNENEKNATSVADIGEERNGLIDEMFDIDSKIADKEIDSLTEHPLQSTDSISTAESHTYSDSSNLDDGESASEDTSDEIAGEQSGEKTSEGNIVSQSEKTIAEEITDGQSGDNISGENTDGQSGGTTSGESADGQPGETTSGESADGQSGETTSGESADGQSGETISEVNTHEQSGATTFGENTDEQSDENTAEENTDISSDDEEIAEESEENLEEKEKNSPKESPATPNATSSSYSSGETQTEEHQNSEAPITLQEGNLKVADSEYIELSEKFRLYGTLLEEKYQAYLNILSVVCQNGISDGQIFENLQAFSETAELLKGQFSSLADTVASFADSFLVDIDDVDEDVY